MEDLDFSRTVMNTTFIYFFYFYFYFFILCCFCRLIHDRELDLFDGTRLLRHDRYDLMMKENSWSEEEMKQRLVQRSS